MLRFLTACLERNHMLCSGQGAWQISVATRVLGAPTLYGQRVTSSCPRSQTRALPKGRRLPPAIKRAAENCKGRPPKPPPPYFD